MYQLTSHYLEPPSPSGGVELETSLEPGSSLVKSSHYGPEDRGACDLYPEGVPWTRVSWSHLEWWVLTLPDLKSSRVKERAS